MMNITTDQVIFLLGQKQLEIEMLRAENQSIRKALSQIMPAAPPDEEPADGDGTASGE